MRDDSNGVGFRLRHVGVQVFWGSENSTTCPGVSLVLPCYTHRRGWPQPIYADIVSADDDPGGLGLSVLKVSSISVHNWQ